MNKKSIIFLVIALAVIVLLGVGLILRGCADSKEPQQTTGEGQMQTDGEGSSVTPATQGEGTDETDGATESTAAKEQDGQKSEPTQPSLSGSESLGSEGIPGEDDDAPAGNGNMQNDTKPQETTSPQENTKPQESTEPQEDKDEPGKTEPTVPAPDSGNETQSTEPAGPEELTYEEYWALSGEQQLAYMMSFNKIEDYLAWYQRASADVEDAPVIELDGTVDLEELFGKK